METTGVLNKVVIAGGSGFLGQSLIKELQSACSEIVVLTRSGGSSALRHGQAVGSGGTRVRHVEWDARTIGSWSAELEGAAALVNLVGRTVDCRKTPAHKKVILDSRVDSIRVLACAMKQCATPPPVWVQAATAHIYGDNDDEVLDESSPLAPGAELLQTYAAKLPADQNTLPLGSTAIARTGRHIGGNATFAPMVGAAWETALLESDLPGVRKVILRISFVLGRHGGPLKTLARLARLGLGGTIGTGRQFMSWIHVDDLNAIIRRAIDDRAMSGVYIATSPGPVENETFMRELRRAVHRPWSPPVPAVCVHIGAWLMRTDPDLALLGRRLAPTRLTNDGFAFQFSSLANALADLLS